MNEIIALARQLGNTIAGHSRTRVFATAAQAVAADPQARQILDAYQEHVTRLQELESKGQPIEAEDRRRLAEFESQLSSNERLREMMKTQADYLELMHRVNEAIDQGSREGL